jgi:hypothetical protein
MQPTWKEMGEKRKETSENIFKNHNSEKKSNSQKIK